MFMFNQNGDQAMVVPEQVAALEAAGWTKEKPVAVKKEDSTDTASAETSASNASETETDTVTGKSESTDDEGEDAGSSKKPGIVLKRKQPFNK